MVLPVTLLSGFLGAGKTTLLKYILSNKQNLKCAVIVNDMAELNIDAANIKNTKVLQKEEKLVQMQNGCICCTLREDLLEEVAALAKSGEFEYLVIESTGISEPMQVAETFTFSLDELMTPGVHPEHQHDHDPENPALASLRSLKDIAVLDTCVTLVDAVNFFATFRTSEYVVDRYEAGDNGTTPEDERTLTELMCDQIEFANVIIINKVDMVSKEELLKIKGVIKSFNHTAEVLEANYAKVDLSKILNTKKFDFQSASTAPGWLRSLEETLIPETEEYGVSSFVYRARKPFHPAKFHKLLSSHFFLDEEGMDGSDDEEEEIEQDAEEERDPSDLSVLKRDDAFAKVLRSKGSCWIRGRDSVFGDYSQAGVCASFNVGAAWFCEIPDEGWPAQPEVKASILSEFTEETGDRRQEIVFIGQFKDGDKEEICKLLDDCLCEPTDIIDSDPLLRWPTADILLEGVI